MDFSLGPEEHLPWEIYKACSSGFDSKINRFTNFSHAN